MFCENGRKGLGAGVTAPQLVATPHAREAREKHGDSALSHALVIAWAPGRAAADATHLVRLILRSPAAKPPPRGERSEDVREFLSYIIR